MVTTKRENIIDPALFSDMNKRIKDAKESVEQNVEWADEAPSEFRFYGEQSNLPLFVKSIRIPDGVTSIPANCFSGCAALETLYVPDGVTTIGSGFCGGCASLKAVRLPGTLSKIDSGSFSACTSLAEIEIPEGVEYLASAAFDRTEIKTLTIPSTVKEVWMGFANNMTKLETVYFKGTPTTIASAAFPNSTNPTDIYVPWAEGEVADAPWGATNATIHYNYVG